MLTDDTISGLRNAIAITLQGTIQKIGFIPDEHGDQVRAIISGDDPIAIMALGCYLDECREHRSYTRLTEGLRDIARAQAKKGPQSP